MRANICRALCNAWSATASAVFVADVRRRWTGQQAEASGSQHASIAWPCLVQCLLDVQHVCCPHGLQGQADASHLQLMPETGAAHAASTAHTRTQHSMQQDRQHTADTRSRGKTLLNRSPQPSHGRLHPGAEGCAGVCEPEPAATLDATTAHTGQDSPLQHHCCQLLLG